MKKCYSVAVIGGGISGLSAAYYAKNFFGEANVDLKLSIYEKDVALGGKIQTINYNGYVIEKGPDSFLSSKMPTIELSQELGLDDLFVRTNPQARSSYILHKHKLHSIPSGLVFGIPTQVTPFIKTQLISPIGKLRTALDLVLPKRKETDDESLGNFLERRLGRQVVKNIVSPLLSGIYAGDAYKLSLNATFPQFGMLEKKYRSLILGMLSSKKHTPQQSLPKAAQGSMFLSYENGLSTLINRLIEKLEDANFYTNVEVIQLKKNLNGYEISLSDGKTEQVDAVILATPTHAASKILPAFNSKKHLEAISYVSVSNVVLAFDQKDLPFELKGSGYIVPKQENRLVTACTWTSSKWLHVAPRDKVLLRLYLGNAHNEQVATLDEEAQLKLVLTELKEILGIRVKPEFYFVNKWEKAMPQYPVGHLDNLKHIITDMQRELPGIYLCGAGYKGVSIPNCISQGKEAAEDLLQYLTMKH